MGNVDIDDDDDNLWLDQSHSDTDDSLDVLGQSKKMLENRPEDALGSLVKTVETERRILKYLTL